MHVPKTTFGVILGICATGAILKLAGDGVLGAYPQKIAKYITQGYGV